jgi:hypothetical protein
MARKRNTENEIVVSTGGTSVRRKTTSPRPRRATTTVTPVETETPAATAAMPVEAELVTPSMDPSYEEIAALAYSYWEARGYQGGSQEEDWLRAEQELRSRLVSTATA